MKRAPKITIPLTPERLMAMLYDRADKHAAKVAKKDKRLTAKQWQNMFRQMSPILLCGGSLTTVELHGR